MKDYNYIFFDADDTIFDFKRAQKEAFIKLYKHLELSLPSQDDAYNAYMIINHALWEDFERGEITQASLRLKRFERFLIDLGINNLRHTPDQLAHFYEMALGEGRYLIDGAEELVCKLSKSFKLAIITNGLKHVQESRLYNSSITSYFKAIIISGVVGYSKPQREIFEIAQIETGFYPSEKVLFVGDSLTSDIVGANAFGFDTCWYNPQHNTVSDNVKPTYEIHQLEELYTILNFK
jgi:2-haloacid dehalogenase